MTLIDHTHSQPFQIILAPQLFDCFVDGSTPMPVKSLDNEDGSFVVFFPIFSPHVCFATLSRIVDSLGR